MELTHGNFLFYLLWGDKALPCNQDWFQVNTRSNYSPKNFNLKHKRLRVRKWPSPCTNLLDVFAVCKKHSRWPGGPQDQATGQREEEGMVAQETWAVPWQQVQVSSPDKVTINVATQRPAWAFWHIHSMGHRLTQPVGWDLAPQPSFSRWHSSTKQEAHDLSNLRPTGTLPRSSCASGERQSFTPEHSTHRHKGHFFLPQWGFTQPLPAADATPTPAGRSCLQLLTPSSQHLVGPGQPPTGHTIMDRHTAAPWESPGLCASPTHPAGAGLHGTCFLELEPR